MSASTTVADPAQTERWPLTEPEQEKLIEILDERPDLLKRFVDDFGAVLRESWRER